MKIGQTSEFTVGRYALLIVVAFLCCLADSSLANSSAKTNDTTKKVSWIPFKATYVGVMNGTTVDDDGVRRLEYLGDKHFRFSAVAENMLFKAEEITEFQVEGEQVIPLQYLSERSTPFNTRKKALGFDWENMRLHYHYRDKKGTKKLPLNTLDPLTSIFDLARQIKQQKTQLQFTEATGKKIKVRRYTLVGEETIDLPYGEVRAVKLAKIESEDDKLFVWMAPDLNHLAVKVQKLEDGEDYQLLLKSYRPEKAIEFTITEPDKAQESGSEAKPMPQVREPPPGPSDLK